jgi:Glucose-6-phosphate dehydrogenase, C-terminal domain
LAHGRIGDADSLNVFDPIHQALPLEGSFSLRESRAARSLRDPIHVRGQYDGYQKIDGVAPGSSTETYVALRLDIGNWRWDARRYLSERTSDCR